ncbi:unnamed protein product [Candida verbasci]|uniref:Mitochondrial escape protein 2 n=1 Tax=Candida verbasci TaxID=1227364 RepID=A0A9W4TS37_9ASCO|nr:unnamed protein product [Candida verbasci]
MIIKQPSRFIKQSQLIPQLCILRPRFYSTDLENLKKESDSTEFDSSASTTGIIDKKQSEVLLYFDSIYAFATSKNLVLNYISRLELPFRRKVNESKLKSKVEALSSPTPADSKITDFIPLRRDCGAFVKFQYPKEYTAREFIEQIRKNVIANEEQKMDKNPLLKLTNYVFDVDPKVFSVKGVPWIEDLRRFPSPKISVKFEGSALTEEELYVLFRRYGLINDIKIESPTEAVIWFRSLRSAIAAKHCITGIELNNGKTVLHIQFIRIKRTNYLTDFVMNHTRIAVPIILALLATFAVLIFDPIREWFIQFKINHGNTKRFEHYKQNRWFKLIYVPYRTIVDWISNSYDYIDTQFHDMTGFKDSDSEDGGSSIMEMKNENNMFWQERNEKSKQLKLWILENLNSYIIIKGPQGSGKEEFVLDHTLKLDDKLNKRILVVECDELSKARSENNLINNTASQLGYFPVFTWTNTISQFVDLGLQGLTGSKNAALSESKETQIKNMFSLTTQAIRHITDSEYAKYVKIIEKKNKRIKNDDEKIEILKQDDFLQQHPESKPIIIINKFARKADIHSNDFIYPLIADWSSGLIQNNIAHVLVLTSDVGSIQHLNNALPNQVFKDISLSDASMKSSKQYVCDALKISDTIQNQSLDDCIQPLGGRMLDLQSFIRRIKSGEEPNQAINEMITQAAELITTFFLNNTKSNDVNWQPSQVWLIMKLLSNKEDVTFAELIKNPLFKNSKETIDTLSTLEKFDLISLKRDKGVLNKICPGRPLFKAAFKNLLHDTRIWNLYEIDYLTNLINIEITKINLFESELIKIHQVGNKLDGRIDYLIKKIEASNGKIVNFEKEINEIATGNSKHKTFLGIPY